MTVTVTAHYEPNLLFFLLAQLSPAAGISLLLLLLLQEDQSVDLVGDAVLRADRVLDLLAADQSGDDAGADNEGQHEAVHAVPVGSAASGSGAGIVVVEEGEGEELADQSILGGEEQSRPGHCWGNDTGDVAAPAELAAVTGPLKTPVNGTKEGEDLFPRERKHGNSIQRRRGQGLGFTYDGTVADLDGLQQVQHQFSTLARE